MKLKLTIAAFGIILLSACSQSNQPSEKPQPKTAEFLTGRTAFQRVYVAAHGWAPDVQPYRLQSQITQGNKDRDGKASLWTAWFASPSRHSTRSYTWCGEDGPDLPARGITPGQPDTYSPTNSSTQVFELSFLKIDSDQGYEVAQKHGGDKALQKDPDLPVSYTLDWNEPTHELIWHVIYGPRGEVKVGVDVDASTGAFFRVEK